MKILVTGAAGFIGSHLCQRLLGAGHKIVGVDNFDDFYSPEVKRQNIASFVSDVDFSLVEADIRNAQLMNTACDDVDAIVHLAAKAGVRPSIAQPLLYADVNVNGTLQLLERARAKGIKKFIFASSSSVYGNNRKVPFSESDSVDGPISPYAATKKAGELICHTYHHLYGLNVTCLRFFTVYGPRQRPDLAIHKFVRFIEKGKPLTVYGDGSMRRDFTYINDIIDGVMAAIERCDGYSIYNLGESEPVTVDELIKAIEKAMGKKAKRKYLPVQPGDVFQTYADVRKAELELGYRHKTTLQVGLAEFIKWFKASK
jgi:UDP-glucuronate 4-epimerase